MALSLAFLLAGAAIVQAQEVGNPSFEEGDGSPAGWTRTGPGEVRSEGVERFVVATGSGDNAGHWATAPLEWTPGGVYRLKFRARGLGGRGGTAVSGPAFCNRDLGDLPDTWTRYVSYFAAPTEVEPEEARLRFGQWHVRGSVGFDALELAPAAPVYAHGEDAELGEGESLAGNEYAFVTPHEGPSRNHCRPLAGANAAFNTNRWVMREGSFVEYRYRVGTRSWTALEAGAAVTWHAAGELAVRARLPGGEWRDLGAIGKVETRAFAVPAEWLPAAEIEVRLEGRGKGCSLQVGGAGARGTLDGEAETLTGATRFVAVLETDPRLRVTVAGLADLRPGGAAAARLRVLNRSRANVTVGQKGIAGGSGIEIRPGEERDVRVPLTIPGPGRHDVPIPLGAGVGWRAEVTVDVPILHAADYGESLGGDVWWCSSGHRVSKMRPAPEAAGSAAVIRAARNEAEAAQVVLRPEVEVKGLRASATDLAGPGGATLPAAAVEILRVARLEIARPTDDAGSADAWPDPLPPLREPLDLAAGTNQPFWIRVTVPKGIAAGLYEGRIEFRADGEWRAEAPLRVEVFDFELPDRMSCTTAFGFDPELVWRYHGLTDEKQKREVLEKYWDSFGRHHISPYDPAPLDRFAVTWKGGDAWQGGERDTKEKHGGKASLKVVDGTTMAQVSATFADDISIPPGGFRLRLHHRAAAPGQKFIVTLSHKDAAGRWMSGRNNDMTVEGGPAWKEFDRAVDRFPEGAKAVTLHLWAAEWRDDGSTTGTAWFDDVSLADAATGAELLRDGGFEDAPGKASRPEFDWRAWDAEMTRVLQKHRFNAFSVPIQGLGSGTYASRAEPELLGFREDTPQYREMFAAYAKGLEGHLKERGWLDEAFVYWFDEPEPRDYAFVMSGYRKLKEAAPGLRRMLTEQPEEALVGGPDVWCPVTAAYERGACDARLAAGETLWWYVCTGPKAPHAGLFVDHPATDLRVWLWQTWQRGISGVLVWQTNYWTSDAAYPDPARPQDPWEDPMSWTSGYGTPPGTRAPWGNGDGRFLYPPRGTAPVLDGPVESIRWEMLRDGIEDYEYLAMLKGLIEAKVGGAEERALLDVPAEITENMTTFTKEPGAIEGRRREVARAIERLSRR
ncbi:MAG: DUF4091 domain-containing protein [Planctomycetes bacterium]|nr:DUF4091 domain-containing protein [Planctomycetota bacterium]